MKKLLISLLLGVTLVGCGETQTTSSSIDDNIGSQQVIETRLVNNKVNNINLYGSIVSEEGDYKEDSTGETKIYTLLWENEDNTSNLIYLITNINFKVGDIIDLELEDEYDCNVYTTEDYDLYSTDDKKAMILFQR
ncbi:hypothetical protein [Gemella morbillorum]